MPWCYKYFNHFSDLSENHFRDVTQLLGPDDLQQLYHALNLTYSDVEKEERNADTTDVNIRALHVLRLWRNRLGRNATRKTILDALEKCRNMEARDILDYTWNERGTLFTITKFKILFLSSYKMFILANYFANQDDLFGICLN